MKKTVFTYIFLFFLCLSLPAKELYVKDKGYCIDLPADWEELDTRDTAAMSFTDPAHTTIFQLFCFSANFFSDAQEILSFIKEQLNAQGEEAPFLYSNMQAYFADLSFSTKNYSVRGYFVLINGKNYDYVLMCFTQTKEYSLMHDFLLSSLDSFAPDAENKLLPGPISQFYYQFPGNNPVKTSIEFNGQPISFTYDRNELEATEVVIAREARILATYPSVNIDAWSRFYRLIYRDNYARFADLALNIHKYLKSVSKDDVKLTSILLSWIQSFKYNNNNQLADLTSPLQAILSHAGDCDSRALVFVILLHSMKIDAVLLVSDRYKHCAAGVALNTTGAKFSFEGKSYLFAELTIQVALGMIAKDMADPSGWLIIRLGNTK
jgi:hypothetical protein